MLVEIAIGDAYGAGFEYAPATSERPNDLTRYWPHPRHRIPPGSYTDDTQMSIAVAETLLQHGRNATAHAFIENFVSAFKRDPREGYAKHFWEFLKSVEDAHDFAERMRPESEKSGAAMRACPIGMLPDIASVLAVAERQARITHNTHGGVRSAQAAALATHYFTYRLGRKADLPHFLEMHIEGNWSEPYSGKVGALGLESARAAITAIVAENTFGNLLIRCVDFTGDVDTVAAIALGAASQSIEYKDDLPENLKTGLENGAWGMDYLQSLDTKLAVLIVAHQ